MAAAAAVSIPAIQPTTMHDSSSTGLDESRPDLPRPYQCPLCDKAFHRLEHQTRHIRTHTGEKPHICQFPGCSKKFSRSDELTRHSRIHNNPNSRRGSKAQHAGALAVTGGGVPEHAMMIGQMMPPQNHSYTTSAPNSTLASPNVSPPHSYTPYSNAMPSTLAPYHGNQGYDGSNPMPHLQRPVDMNILADAASQVARENAAPSYQQAPIYQQVHPYQHTIPYMGPAAQVQRSRHHHQHQHYHPYNNHTSSIRLPGLSQYHYTPHSSQPMSRSHSHDDREDHDGHRYSKRSRPASPQATAPSSPTFSCHSCSPTPSHTPARTPADSPRLSALHRPEVQLPGLRNLSLQHKIPYAPLPPALEPLEPSTEAAPGGTLGGPSPPLHPQHSYMSSGPHTPYSRSQNNSGRISDILNRSDAAQRKLPVPEVPRMAMQEILGPSAMGQAYGSGFGSSGNSSAAGSVSGDYPDRW